jgi:hypothetical protein
MRRMTLKFRETENLLKLVQNKVNENYDLFTKENFNKSRLKELELVN